MKSERLLLRVESSTFLKIPRKFGGGNLQSVRVTEYVARCLSMSYKARGTLFEYDLRISMHVARCQSNSRDVLCTLDYA